MKKLVAIFISVLFFASACEKEQTDPQKMQEVSLTPVQKSLVVAGNVFAFNLFSELCRQQSASDRIFISPYSISEALTMTYNGAANATADSMSGVLGYEGMSKDDINAYCKTLRTTLLDLDPKVKLAIANSIWYRKGFDVLEFFMNINTTYFDAAVKGLDFSDPSSKDVINGWIEDKTNDRIKNMIQEIDPETVMFLVNAIWFKGQWASRFDKDKTCKGDFYLKDGTSMKTYLMNQSDTFNYYTNNLFQMAELPYGQGNFAMDVLLPAEGKTADDVLPELTAENWQNWISELQGQKLQLEFPRLKFEYGSGLNQVLSALGMRIAFNPLQADFTNINPNGGLYIDSVLHKSFIEVNEEGTEAAAATVVSVSMSSIDPVEIPFVVNKPFIFLIRERSTGAILFIGRINVPANS